MSTLPRAIAVALIEHPDTGAIFVSETRWALSPWFHRAAGGGIEPGERAAEALRREFREEFDTEIVVGARVEVLENIFWIGEDLGHEVVFVFRAQFTDPVFLDVDGVWPVIDSDLEFGLWRPRSCSLAERPLYPDGLPELLGLSR